MSMAGRGWLGWGMLAILAAFAGCGYHLVGTGSTTLPAHLKDLFVAPFVNQTVRAELDQRLTEEVTQEWVRRGRFQLVSSADQADAVLSGTIVSVTTSPVRFDEQGRVTQFQLTVAADVQIVDRTVEPPQILWRDKHFSRTSAYEVDASALDYFDREIEAMERVARDFARGLVVTVLEGF